MTDDELDLRYEFYETPEPFTQWMIDEVVALTGAYDFGVVCDPMFGLGAITRAFNRGRLRARWVTGDLDPRRAVDVTGDATQYDTWRALVRAAREIPYAHGIDWTVTNPAFSATLPLLELALRYSTRGVAVHVRSTINEPLKTPGLGRSFLREHPPTMTLWLPRFSYRRSRTTGKWATDSATCCWLVWIRDHRQVVRYAPEWVIDASQEIMRARGTT